MSDTESEPDEIPERIRETAEAVHSFVYCQKNQEDAIRQLTMILKSGEKTKEPPHLPKRYFWRNI